MATKRDITVVVGDMPTLTWTLYTRTADRTRVPSDLTGSQVRLLVKPTQATPDAEATVYQGQILDAPGGRVAFEPNSLGVKERQVYKLVVVRNGRPVTYSYGTINKERA